MFAVVADAVIAAKRAGKPLMGAMFWNAAYGGEGRSIAAALALILFGPASCARSCNIQDQMHVCILILATTALNTCHDD